MYGQTDSLKGEQWIRNKDIEDVSVSSGVTQKILTFCDMLMRVENYFESGAAEALHSHSHAQIIGVAECCFSFTVGDEIREVRKGDTMCNRMLLCMAEPVLKKEFLLISSLL